MIQCKRCQSEAVIKNGKARGKQRYRCKQCAYNFIEGDGRINASLVVEKALAVVLYALGKASFNKLGQIFGHSPSLLYRWIVEEAAMLPESVVPGGIREMEFDEMSHFIGSKKTSSGSSGWIVAQGELLRGWSAIVMLQRSVASTTKLNT
ncbi:MAG: IS1 family transposase [Gammaproteobacteria bacterium]